MVVDSNGHATSLDIQDGEPIKQTSINRTKIAVTVILGTLILGFVILCSVLLTGHQPLHETVTSAQRRNIRGIDLDEVLSQQLSPSDFNGSFISATEILYRNRNADIIILNIETKETEIVLAGNHPSLSGAISYTLSPDRKYLLVAHYRQKLYRYSFIGSYDMVDLSTKIAEPLTSTDGFRLHLLATWGPVGNAIVFVTHNTHDIYYKASVKAQARRLTSSGVSGIVYNGVPDWVNEEEVVSANRALWMSPDGKRLAFASYNDSTTRIMSIPYYGIPGHLDFQYTRAVNIRYPKPGTPNPVTSLFVTSLDGLSAPVALPSPAELKNSEPILFSAVWISADHLLATWLNRIQNESYFVVCSAETLSCRNILELKEPKGWISTAPPLSIANGTKIAMILPQTQQTGGQFRQVCLGEMGSNGEYNVRPLTSGPITVSAIKSFNEESQKIIYEAVEADTPEAQHAYEIDLAGDAEPRCITCGIKTKLQKKPCLYNDVKPSIGDAYVLSCLGPGVPEVSVRDGNHDKMLTWEDNRQIYEDVRSRQMPIVERFKVKVPGGFEAAVAMHLPPDVDRSGAIKYPLLIHVYGGPDSSQSSERFTVDWNVFLAVNKSVIVASIDGRGSGNKGNDMLFSVYRNLGDAEIEDQISVTRYLQNKYSYIDKKHTAIWGWSYGGYATTMALIKDRKNVFKCGIAIAPVSDWSLYDTIYAERYMGLPRPGDNLLGYAAASLNDKVENLRNKELFLIHGTLDDNVHYQQSMLLAKSLEQHDILFRQQSYVDEDHGLGGVRPHLFHSLDKFLDECFDTNEVR